MNVRPSAALPCLALACLVQSMGCATPNWGTMTKVKIPLAEIAPPETMQRQVVLLPVENGSDGAPIRDNTSRIVELIIQQVISEGGAVVLDRNIYKELVDEIIAIEEGDGESVLEIKGATDAVKGSITSVEHNSDFNPASSWTDAKGKRHNTPASCSFTARVTGLIEVYGMRPLSLRESIFFSGTQKNKVQMNNSSCPISETQMKANAEAAARIAASADCAAVGLQNALAPVGYVREYRRMGGGSGNYFRTSLTPREGANVGEIGDILHQSVEVDPVSRKETVRPERVATGKFEQEESGLILIHVKDAAAAGRVMAGDLVTLRHKKSWIPVFPDPCSPTGTATATPGSLFNLPFR